MKLQIIKVWTLLLVLVSTAAMAQNDSISESKKRKSAKMQRTNKPTFELLDFIVVDGDTLPVVNMPVVRVVDRKVFKSKRQARKYWRLVRNVKKAYPYARAAADKFEKYEGELSEIERKGKRRRIMKRVEQELVDEYTEELSNLTVTQGRILLKLIDRETGDVPFEIIKDMRGGLSAFFWQSLATLFDSDLKREYEPNGEDKEIEEIVVKIEKGEL